MAITASTSLASGEVEQYLDTRALNCCEFAKCYTVGDVAAMSRNDMREVRACGPNTMIKLDRLLKAAGLWWSWKQPKPPSGKRCFELAQMLYVSKLNDRPLSFMSDSALDTLAKDCVNVAKRFCAIAEASLLDGGKEAKDGNAQAD